MQQGDNRTLARPYLDAEQLPVTMAHCLGCVEEGRRRELAWQTSGSDCYMGIDQMGSFNVCILKRRLPDNRQAVVHIDAIYNDNPFSRCDELMERFGVIACVLEQLPNINDARRFANRHPRRVFLASYAELRDEMMRWGNSHTKSDRRTIAESRSRYTVSISQYKAMQASLCRIQRSCGWIGGCAITGDRQRACTRRRRTLGPARSRRVLMPHWTNEFYPASSARRPSRNRPIARAITGSDCAKQIRK